MERTFWGCSACTSASASSSSIANEFCRPWRTGRSGTESRNSAEPPTLTGVLISLSLAEDDLLNHISASQSQSAAQLSSKPLLRCVALRPASCPHAKKQDDFSMGSTLLSFETFQSRSACDSALPSRGHPSQMTPKKNFFLEDGWDLVSGDEAGREQGRGRSALRILTSSRRPHRLVCAPTGHRPASPEPAQRTQRDAPSSCQCRR